MLRGRAKKARCGCLFHSPFSMADKIVRRPFRAGVLKKHTPFQFDQRLQVGAQKGQIFRLI